MVRLYNRATGFTPTGSPNEIALLGDIRSELQAIREQGMRSGSQDQ